MLKQGWICGCGTRRADEGCVACGGSRPKQPAIPYLPNSSQRGYYTRIAERTKANDAKGYSRQHVSGVLQGTRSYSDTSLRVIASACGVEVGWLADYIEYVKLHGVPIEGIHYGT